VLTSREGRKASKGRESLSRQNGGEERKGGKRTLGRSTLGASVSLSEGTVRKSLAIRAQQETVKETGLRKSQTGRGTREARVPFPPSALDIGTTSRTDVEIAVVEKN